MCLWALEQGRCPQRPVFKPVPMFYEWIPCRKFATIDEAKEAVTILDVEFADNREVIASMAGMP